MRKTVFIIVLALIMVCAAGCANYDFAQTGQYIITAKDALAEAESGAILVDAQPQEDYASCHIEGAVNVPMSKLTVDEPYANMLPDTGRIESVMGAAGISETDTILVYDNTANMQAARVQWTLNVFNNFNIKVVSGGLNALLEAGGNESTTESTLPAAAYTCGEKQKNLVVNLDYINLMINKPEEGTVIIDTRSDDEYNAGTIPGSVHIEYIWNNYASGQYKSPMDLQSTYLDNKIYPEMKLIVFCKTSVRAAQTYTALKDAGYQDVRVYDGAWAEYSSNNEPVVPVETTVPIQQDAS